MIGTCDASTTTTNGRNSIINSIFRRRHRAFLSSSITTARRSISSAISNASYSTITPPTTNTATTNTTVNNNILIKDDGDDKSSGSDNNNISSDCRISSDGDANSTTTSSTPMFIKLYTFPSLPYCYSMSPFALKLESYLRVNHIPYETQYGLYFNVSNTGTIPCIELVSSKSKKQKKHDSNNKNSKDDDDLVVIESISDSNIIIQKLETEYDYDPIQKALFRRHPNSSSSSSTSTSTESILTPYQKAITHSIIRMLEEHTAQIGFHYRYGNRNNIETLCNVLDIDCRLYNNNQTKSILFRTVQPNYTLTKSKYRMLSRHNDNTLYELSNYDIQALSDLLGPKNHYFHGGSKATLIDCAVFAHLVQFLYIPMHFPQKQYIQNNCPNLITFMERFKTKYWPDWENKCKQTNVR